MTPSDFNDQIISPALDWMGRRFDSPEARVLMLAIALQESEMKHRWQVIDKKRPELKGPARGFFQMERGGGVFGVMHHPATSMLALRICAYRAVMFTSNAVWQAIETDDILAAVFARLLLFSDPAPLPAVSDAQGAWGYYVRTWRPGKPHLEKWPVNHEAALEVMYA